MFVLYSLGEYTDQVVNSCFILCKNKMYFQDWGGLLIQKETQFSQSLNFRNYYIIEGISNLKIDATS